MTSLLREKLSEIEVIKSRQKATWESGDFGELARYLVPTAEQFMAQVPLAPGLRVLDAACGTGNLAVIAARAGCRVSGVDIAANLIKQARRRQGAEGIDYREGDAEALPFPDGSFDVVVSMFGVMFAPRPQKVTEELLRVTRPGGLIAMANWTTEGFVGKVLKLTAAFSPPPAPGLPSPLLWGDESVVRERFGEEIRELKLSRRMARIRFPFSPEKTVAFLRRYFGPIHVLFGALESEEAAALEAEMENLYARNNISADPGETCNPSEYLEVQAVRM